MRIPSVTLILIWQIVTILQLVVFSTCDQYNAFYDIHLVSTDTYGDSIATFRARSIIECFTRCTETSSCRSMSYDAGTKSCQMNRVAADPSMLSTACGSTCTSKYAAKECKMGTPCTADSDCETSRNQTCRAGTCVCLTGYSFHEVTCDCVTECSSYGTTFALLPGVKMKGGNNRNFPLNSDTECNSACAAETEFVCKTSEYNYRKGRCHLQNYTVLDEPTQYDTDSNFNLFVRNCG